MAPINEIELQDMLYSASLPEYTGPISIRYPRGCCQGLELPKEFNKIEIGKAWNIPCDFFICRFGFTKTNNKDE
jgi:1-deoxy-D-xylulose-5-phosphate synthase